MKHSKILIAEDEPRRAHLIQMMLEAEGFQVLRAADVAKAWRILQSRNLVLAIIDTHLPGLQEHNLLLCVRRNPGLANLPVVILGDALESEQAVEWLNQGADDYLSRSISSELLKAQVHAKLRRGKTNA